MAGLDADRYDIAFADPPYTSTLLDRVIECWWARRYSRILAVQHAREHQLPAGAVRKTFNESAITMYRT